MKVPSINGLGKLNRIACAINVDSGLAFLICTQVIDSRQVIKMTHLAFEFFDVFSTDAQFFAGQIAMHSHRPCGIDAPVSTQGRHLTVTFLADQEMHRCTFSLQKFFHQAFTNEAGGPRDEIMHSRCPCVFRLPVNEALILA